jgi:hypothetical protein
MLSESTRKEFDSAVAAIIRDVAGHSLHSGRPFIDEAERPSQGFRQAGCAKARFRDYHGSSADLGVLADDGVSQHDRPGAKAATGADTAVFQAAGNAAAP